MKKIPIPLDSGTFGKGQCIVAFTDILSKTGNKKLIRRVGSLWTDYSNGFKEIAKMDEYKCTFAFMWRERIIKSAKRIPMPKKAKTYFLNIIATKFKVFFREEIEPSRKNKQHYH